MSFLPFFQRCCEDKRIKDYEVLRYYGNGGDIEVSKINCYKKCRETLKGNKIQLCTKHSTFVVTIYVPSVNKEST